MPIYDGTAIAVVLDMAKKGEDINDALNYVDSGPFVSMFVRGATFTDPVNPTMTPGVGLLHTLYGGSTEGSEALAEANPDRALPHGDSVLLAAFGNGRGPVTEVAFDVGRPLDALHAIRETPMAQSTAEWGKHRLEVEMLRTFPQEVIDHLYLPDGDMNAATEIVTTADQFIGKWEAAWATSDPAALFDLYEQDATRDDALVGHKAGDELLAWYALLFSTHPAVTMDIRSVYGNTEGPAAIYQLSSSRNDQMCAMSIVSIWNLGDDGLIEDEYVYYSPDDVISCGWAP